MTNCNFNVRRLCLGRGRGGKGRSGGGLRICVSGCVIAEFSNANILLKSHLSNEE